ncbi:MFS transporter [Saccharospirillum sp. MSK14-1]|uniref:MFS transporter n=1 Tax=Saccharospirillum sp. MSK14-1 TaxID=1897632 RepID=UPI000D3C7C95|nr:MFS transporter [Saccharospirillum sp. MSK14-1]PTY36603.1 MFS transporter [Saccharospirillum sp. MSK14-1]
MSSTKSYRRSLPAGVWVLGFVSLLMDVSSEMIHSLLPLYLVGVLGASALTLGLIEGFAEATAMMLKVFSGALSDYWRKRKGLALLGYGLAAITKPVFALAPSVGWVLAARLTDRVGKGIRGAPRDALVADLTPPQMRGAAYGLRQSLDTIGAFVGPVLAIALMALLANNYQWVFWIAVIPAFLAVILLCVGLREPERQNRQNRGNPIQFSHLKRFTQAYWAVVLIGSLFTLARFSEAFLLLKAEDAGLSLLWAPLVLVVMNIAFSLSAYPSGRMSDRMDPRQLLAAGLLLLIVADLVLAWSSGWFSLMIGAAFWGLHMGMTQGLLATLVARTAPAESRGTAFGIFNLIMGLTVLLASIIAGLLWTLYSPALTFVIGALFCLLTLSCLGILKRPSEVA